MKDTPKEYSLRYEGFPLTRLFPQCYKGFDLFWGCIQQTCLSHLWGAPLRKFSLE